MKFRREEMRRKAYVTPVLAAMLSWAATADAAVVISTKATQNMSCSAGVCTPTAKKAVLNVGDLANLLTAGDVKVVSDKAAKDIQFAAPLSWTSTSRLTLDSYRSIVFQQPVSVTGTGALTIITNDGGSEGDFWFEKKGHIQFWDLKSSLVTNGTAFTLIFNIKQLARAVTSDPAGNYALAKPYNASKDGTYSQAPVSGDFAGIFEGLGNTISNLSIMDDRADDTVGFFAELYGTVHNLNFTSAALLADSSVSVGIVAGTCDGTVNRVGVSGMIVGGGSSGGLAGIALGSVLYSHASVDITGAGSVGGLIGDSLANVSYSFATGSLSGGDGFAIGGLAGVDEGGLIYRSYTTASATGGNEAAVGGFIGSQSHVVYESYSTGAVTGGSGSSLGGFYGIAFNQTGNNNDYWDTDTSGTDQAAGNAGVIVGVTGLNTAQFRAGLPPGFDSKVWGQKATINNGYPYLLANPPTK